MPYNTYTNESDSRFAGQLDDYKLGLNRVVADDYASAAAAFDTLPESMAVGQIMRMRSAANDDSMRTRKLVADDQQAAAEEDDFMGFSDRVSKLRGLPQDRRAAAIQDELLSNPNLLRNKDVNDVVKGIFDTDKFSLNARENILNKQKQDIEQRMVTEETDTLEDRFKLNRDITKNALRSSILDREKTDLTLNQIQNGHASQIGSYLASHDWFTPEESDYKDKILKITGQLIGDDTSPEDRSSLAAFATISGSLAEVSRMPEVFRTKMAQHSGLIQSVRSASGGKIDLANLSKDPAERKAQIDAAAKGIASNPKIPARSISDFNDLVESIADHERTSAEIGATKDSFFKAIDRIDALRGDPSPEAKQKIKDELVVLRAKAPGLSAHYRQLVDEQNRDLKRRETESEIDGRIARAKATVKNGVLAERKLALESQKAAMRDKWYSFRSNEERARYFGDVVNDGDFTAFGFEDTPTLEQFAERMDKYNPIPGASSVDMED